MDINRGGRIHIRHKEDDALESQFHGNDALFLVRLMLFISTDVAAAFRVFSINQCSKVKKISIIAVEQ